MNALQYIRATVEPQEIPGVYDAYKALVEALVKRQGGHTTNKSAMLVVPGKAGLAARVHGFQHERTYRVYITVFAPSLQEETWDIGEEDFQIGLEGYTPGVDGPSAVRLILSRTWSRKTKRVTMHNGELVGRLAADCATLVKKLEAEFAPNFWKLRYFMPREGNKLVSLAVVNKVRAEQAAARRTIDNA